MYEVPPLFPNETELCMYAQYLKNSHPSPQTVKNYMSGAKTWILEHGGNVQPFLSRELDQLTKGFVKFSDHVPSRAAPLSISHLLVIAEYVRCNPYVPCAVLPCIIIGFKCFLRSSNLLSPSTRVWGGPHTLLARDLVIKDNSLMVSVLSTKTKSNNQPESFVLESETDHRLCPVALWRRYLNIIKPSLLGPAFLTDSKLPLTPRHIVGVMRAALASSKDIDPGKVSMHSIRRGAAQDAADRGVPLSHIQTLGLWRSDSGVKPYLDNFPHIFKR